MTAERSPWTCRRLGAVASRSAPSAPAAELRSALPKPRVTQHNSQAATAAAARCAASPSPNKRAPAAIDQIASGGLWM